MLTGPKMFHAVKRVAVNRVAVNRAQLEEKSRQQVSSKCTVVQVRVCQ